MRDFLKGWEDRSKVRIPAAGREGFSGNIIIRDPVKPVKKKLRFFVRRLKTGERSEVKKDGFVIGKSSDADFAVSDNPTVSRRHAMIHLKADGCWLEDMQSANHVFVNGQRILSEVKLTDGMIFRLSEDEQFEFMVREGL